MHSVAGIRKGGMTPCADRKRALNTLRNTESRQDSSCRRGISCQQTLGCLGTPAWRRRSALYLKRYSLLNGPLRFSGAIFKSWDAVIFKRFPWTIQRPSLCFSFTSFYYTVYRQLLESHTRRSSGSDLSRVSGKSIRLSLSCRLRPSPLFVMRCSSPSSISCLLNVVTDFATLPDQ